MSCVGLELHLTAKIHQLMFLVLHWTSTSFYHDFGLIPLPFTFTVLTSAKVAWQLPLLFLSAFSSSRTMNAHIASLVFSVLCTPTQSSVFGRMVRHFQVFVHFFWAGKVLAFDIYWAVSLLGRTLVFLASCTFSAYWWNFTTVQGLLWIFVSLVWKWSNQLGPEEKQKNKKTRKGKKTFLICYEFTKMNRRSHYLSLLCGASLTVCAAAVWWNKTSVRVSMKLAHLGTFPWVVEVDDEVLSFDYVEACVVGSQWAVIKFTGGTASTVRPANWICCDKNL